MIFEVWNLKLKNLFLYIYAPHVAGLTINVFEILIILKEKKFSKARNQRRREVLDIWVLEIMSASIEALAMAGVDYLIHNLDIEEWEQEELELPPPHLLAEEEEEVERKSKDNFPICRCCPASGKKDGARSDYVITEQPLNIIQ